MENQKQYWGNQEEQVLNLGFQMEGRAAIAFRLIEHFASVAGTIEGEDTAGRSKMRLQAPAEVVARAFAIADEFVDVAERRGEIRGIAMTLEEKAQRVGDLERIKTHATWKRDEVDAAALKALREAKEAKK